MKLDNLNTNTSFSWLAREIVQSREAASLRDASRLIPSRLPADFSADDAILKGRRLRALYLGGLLGSGAKAVFKAIASVVGGLMGRSGGDEAAAEQTRVSDKAA